MTDNSIFKYSRFIRWLSYSLMLGASLTCYAEIKGHQALKQTHSDSKKTSAGRALAKILSGTQTFTADFEQKVYQEASSNAEVSNGRLSIKRPHQFKWQTMQPYEQTIVADGQNLWIYDPELEQVTVQKQKVLLADSPILLLTSSIESLSDNFNIEYVNSRELKATQMLFSLQAKSNSLFETIHILTEGNKLKELFLVDTLGGRSLVVFSKIKLNGEIDPNSFIFVPPMGIDLIDSREKEPEKNDE